MKLVFLYGPPAVGKLTVARELASLSGYPLFHNHLVVDALTAVFPFGSDAFVALRERWWLDVMREAGGAGVEGLIFTFAPERTVRDSFVGNVREVVEEGGGEVVFVRLCCSEDVLEQRIADPSRRGSGKLTSVSMYRQLRAEGAFDVAFEQPPDLDIDTTEAKPGAVALEIADRIGGKSP